MHATSCNPSTSTTRTPSASTTRNICLPRRTSPHAAPLLHRCNRKRLHRQSVTRHNKDAPATPHISGVTGASWCAGGLVLDGCQVSTQLCKGRTCHVEGGVLVGAGSHYRRVPQDLGDHLSVNPEREQQGGGGMSCVVASDAWRPSVSK